MSHGNQSYLRFSLEESVWFQKGQEVDELVSISLDPNITIQESDQYITIKGSLELSGEYNREDINTEEEIEFQDNPRTIQSVISREEGLDLFTHHFPVEVTIPKNRIQNLNDIDVTVETFDYAFPEKSCLRLSADLMITGLYGEQQHELFHEQEEVELQPYFRDSSETESETYDGNSPFAKPELEEEDIPEMYTPFEVEAKREPELEVQNADEEEAVEIELSKQDQFPYTNPPVQQDNLVEMSRSVGEETEEETEVEISSFEQVEETEEDVEPRIEDYPEITFAKRHENTPDLIAEKIANDEVYEEVVMEEQVESESSSSSSSSEPQQKKGKKWSGKKSLTLSEFFARREEEEHTRLKMCIVQHGDNLDSISERYHVPVSQIQRVNEMELNQDIYEGQVLYIPVTQTQK